MKPQTSAFMQERPIPSLSPAEMAPEIPKHEAFGTLLSSELLQGLKCVQINHNGTVYRLQATKLGKLILTK